MQALQYNPKLTNYFLGHLLRAWTKLACMHVFDLGMICFLFMEICAISCLGLCHLVFCREKS